MPTFGRAVARSLVYDHNFPIGMLQLRRVPLHKLSGDRVSDGF